MLEQIGLRAEIDADFDAAENPKRRVTGVEFEQMRSRDQAIMIRKDERIQARRNRGFDLFGFGRTPAHRAFFAMDVTIDFHGQYKMSDVRCFGRVSAMFRHHAGSMPNGNPRGEIDISPVSITLCAMRENLSIFAASN